MHRIPLALFMFSVCAVVGLAVGQSPPAHADELATVDTGPELRVVSVVHGVTFTLAQHELVPGTQGPTTMVTHVHSAVPPGPPQIDGAVPPGPPQIDLVVRVTAPTMELGHAAGAFAALGIMRGLTPAQITATFAQLNWGIQQITVNGQVDPASTIDATKAGALSQLVIATIIAGDRPGGGCDAAIPYFQQGAAALGFGASCLGSPNQP